MVIKNLGFRLCKKSIVPRASSGLKDHQQVLDLKFQTCNLTPAQKLAKLKSPCLKQINSQSTSKMQGFSIKRKNLQNYNIKIKATQQKYTVNCCKINFLKPVTTGKKVQETFRILYWLNTILPFQ